MPRAGGYRFEVAFYHDPAPGNDSQPLKAGFKALARLTDAAK